MHLTFSFPAGRRIEGVLLAIGRYEMRVALPEQQDTVEFRLVDGYWTAEDGERIELDALVHIPPTAVPQPISRAAGMAGMPRQ
jgi:hypothetical protein